jgi:hypothetical protein
LLDADCRLFDKEPKAVNVRNTVLIASAHD